MSNLTVTVDPVVAEGDTVMALVTWSSTAADSGDDANGNGAGVFRIECGKIAESWAVGDQLGHLMAIGGITEDELASITTEAKPVP